jgi:hypothetical protein
LGSFCGTREYGLGHVAEPTPLYAPSTKERKRIQDLSVLILTPCKDYEVPSAFARSVVNMVAYSWLNGLRVFQMAVSERMVVHYARNHLAKLAQEHVCGHTGQRYSHILWLDDDHVFNPDLALYLAKHSDLDMVSALYFGRVGRQLPVVYVKDGNQDLYTHYQMLELQPALCQVDAVGFGACLMRMDVLDRMQYPWFRFNEAAGEDIYFCVHAKERGIEIYCDGAYKIGHLGEPEVVTQETSLRFLESKRDEYADRIKVPLGGNGQWLKQSGKPDG